MHLPVLLTATLALGGPGTPGSPVEIATKLATEYASSMRRRDHTWLAKHSDPSLIFSTVNEGDQNREALLVRLKQIYSMTKEVSQATVKVVSAKRKEGGLLVVTDTRMSFKLPFHGNSMQAVDLKTREESLWVKKGSTWRVSSIKQLKDDSTIDGRPLLFRF